MQITYFLAGEKLITWPEPSPPELRTHVTLRQTNGLAQRCRVVGVDRQMPLDLYEYQGIRDAERLEVYVTIEPCE